MNRREFILSSAAGVVLPASSLSANATEGPKRALMKLGCQSGPSSDKRLQFFARHGIKNICAVAEFADKELGIPTVGDMPQRKERPAKWYITIDMWMPPFLASTRIDRTARPAILLGQSPERDRD